jgi:glycosyltransferase involved in cell wall biosynthesis
MSDGSVGFILCSGLQQPLPSTRIAVLNMLPFFQSAGLQPHILFHPPQPTETPELTGVAEKAIASNCKVVVLQKVGGPSAVALARQLKSAGIHTIFSICDRIDPEMVEATDATIVISDFLKSLYPAALQSRIHVVHDGIENPDICKNDWGTQRAPIEAVLVTSHFLTYLPVIEEVPSWLRVRIVGRYQHGWRNFHDMRWKWAKKTWSQRAQYVKFMLNRQIECVPWGAESVYLDMLGADIGLIPINTAPRETDTALPPDWMRKSENRLTLKMSMGLPVIATPIPAYESLIENGVNGILANSARDWAAGLHALRDPARRREMGLAARDSVSTRFSMQNQATKFIRVVRGLG